MKTQTFVDNAVNDLPYEIKFENCVTDKNNFFIKRNIAFFLEEEYSLFSATYFLRFLRI